MKSFLVHIYPRGVSHSVRHSDSHNETEIIGVVEGTDGEKQKAFTSPAELWNILKGRSPYGPPNKKQNEIK